MVRNFKDWLTAYAEYAQDEFCPPHFHFWTGLSVLAGALERRTWLTFENFNLFPNIYVLLVARPGMGKSTASNIGVYEMLRPLAAGERKVNFLATKQSEASFDAQMEQWTSFFVGDQKHTQSAGFFYASEASNSLKEVKGGGDILSSLTEYYDCPPLFEKKLVSQDPIIVRNACCNVLGCSTFSFLRQLIPQSQAEGGFASRLLYIIQDEVRIRTPKWNKERRSPVLREQLLADLNVVYGLSGPFRPTRAFCARFEDWFPKQDATTQGMLSERMQLFLSRKHTNLMKLAMLCSVAESDSLELDIRHWDRAETLMNEVEKNLSRIIEHSKDKASPQGLGSNILMLISRHGSDGTLEREKLLAHLIRHGTPPNIIDSTIATLNSSGLIAIEVGGPGRFRYRLKVRAEDYL